MGDSDLGQLFHYRFSLPYIDETQTTHQPPRPIPIHVRDQVAKEIKTWQDLGIISETQSSNNIPLIILRKPDKSIRISLDARGLLVTTGKRPLPVTSYDDSLQQDWQQTRCREVLFHIVTRPQSGILADKSQGRRRIQTGVFSQWTTLSGESHALWNCNSSKCIL